MLDASGQYGGGRTSDVVDSLQAPITIDAYLNYFDNEELLTVFRIELSETDESYIKELISSVEGRGFMTCATEASALLKKSGSFPSLKNTPFPKILLADMLKIAENNQIGRASGRERVLRLI